MELEEKKTYLIEMSKGFAQFNELPVFFEGAVLRKTPKAYYLYGTGTLRTKAMGICMKCGRELTHPVSIALGIGPVCGEHYHDWNTVGGYTEENIARLTELVENTVMVDQWLPKSICISAEEIDRQIAIPADHKMLTNNKSVDAPRKGVLKGKTIVITFPFNNVDLGNVKTLTGRRFSKDGGPHWTAPFAKETVEKLIEWKFEISKELETEYQLRFAATVETTDEIEIPGLIGPGMFPFQKQGVAFVERRNGNAIIGDSMGLGKTVQALAYLQLHPEKRPAVIVVPASLKLNWQKECRMWLPNPDIGLISGKKINKDLLNHEILIINYDILNSWVASLKEINPQVLITDECHYYKSTTALRTKAVKKLAKVCPHVIALSGTPIVNRPVEFFNAINLVEPGLFPSFWKYAHTYCGAKHNHFGWDFSGATNTKELYEQLQSIMIRRKKEDVLKDLPAKIRSVVPLELTATAKAEYQKAASNIIQWIKENEGAEKAEKASQAKVLTEINKLKQLSTKGKLDSCIDWIRNFLDVDGKLVVFAENHWVIDTIMSAFPDISVKLDGRDSQPNRNHAVEQFQNDESIRLFVGNFQAAGVGITLTAAANTCFVQLPWSPGVAVQAEDRVHRIGQEADSVNAYYLIADGTIENSIAGLLDRKTEVLTAILDGKVPDQMSLLTELLNELRK